MKWHKWILPSSNAAAVGATTSIDGDGSESCSSQKQSQTRVSRRKRLHASRSISGGNGTNNSDGNPSQTSTATASQHAPSIKVAARRCSVKAVLDKVERGEATYVPERPHPLLLRRRQIQLNHREQVTFEDDERVVVENEKEEKPTSQEEGGNGHETWSDTHECSSPHKDVGYSIQRPSRPGESNCKSTVRNARAA